MGKFDDWAKKDKKEAPKVKEAPKAKASTVVRRVSVVEDGHTVIKTLMSDGKLVKEVAWNSMNS